MPSPHFLRAARGDGEQGGKTDDNKIMSLNDEMMIADDNKSRSSKLKI